MKSFDALGLSGELLEAVRQLGFETPTPIQEQSIPILLSGNTDFVGLAQTGTGKTAAFGLPLVELVNESDHTTQALILAPTRELSVQITADLEKFSKAVKNLNIVTVYGGASISDQIRKVRRGAHIIVATPGRLIDLLSRKVVNLTTIKYVILDEDTLKQRPYTTQGRKQTPLQNRDIIKLFDGLTVSESFLLKTNVREFLFRKPQVSG